MTGKLFRTCAIATTILLVSAFATTRVGAASSFRTVALSGLHAPDTPPGVLYEKFFTLPTINDTGQVAVMASLKGSDIDNTNWSGIWSEGSGPLGLIARENQPAPGTETGVVFNGFGPPVINHAGQTAFTGHLTGPGIQQFRNGSGIWSEGSGSLELVARDGDQGPGTSSGQLFYTFFGNNPVLNDAGHIVFKGGLRTIDGAQTGSGIWSGGVGTLGLVTQSGADAPEMGPNVQFRGSGSFEINNNGHIVFANEVFGPGIDNSNNSGLWQYYNGSISSIVRAGERAPGFGPGNAFGYFSPSASGIMAINDAGTTAFKADIDGPDVTFFNDDGIWISESGSLHLAAIEGMSAPGTEDNKVFSTFGSLDLNRTCFKTA